MLVSVLGQSNEDFSMTNERTLNEVLLQLTMVQRLKTFYVLSCFSDGNPHQPEENNCGLSMTEIHRNIGEWELKVSSTTPLTFHRKREIRKKYC